jgi:hypothetical protein
VVVGLGWQVVPAPNGSAVARTAPTAILGARAAADAVTLVHACSTTAGGLLAVRSTLVVGARWRPDASELRARHRRARVRLE